MMDAELSEQLRKEMGKKDFVISALETAMASMERDREALFQKNTKHMHLLDAQAAELAGMREALGKVKAAGEEAHRIGTSDSHSFQLGIATGTAFKALSTPVGKREKALMNLVRAASAVVADECYRKDGLKIWHPDLVAALSAWREGI